MALSNTGKDIGYMCGTVTVTNTHNNMTNKSNTFCSGAVGPKDTITKSFDIVDLATLCKSYPNYEDSWIENCTMKADFTSYEN